MNQYYVYIMSNFSKCLYIGVTNDLYRRAYEHKNHLIDDFTKKSNLAMLVYYETTNDVEATLRHEKQLKG